MKSKRVVILVMTIVFIGLMMVYSASNIWAGYKFNDSLYYIKRQALFAVIGIIAMFIFSKIDYHIYQKNANKILIFCFILMILVLIPGLGSVRGGSRSWFNLGIISLQPSELFKIAIIIYSASYISNHYHELKRLKASIKLLVVLSLGFGLIMLQPDFGSGFVMVCSIIVMLIVSPFPFKYFIMLGILGVIGIVLMIISAPYRLARIVAFLNPFADPLGSGFQIIQSLYAIAPGGILGVGFNNSVQKHFYLPEPQTDFIFSIIAEEFGVVGAFIVVGLFSIILWRGIKIATNTKDTFSKYLSFGMIFQMIFQALMNLMVVIGMIPVTGVTLPFLSYGGSSLLISMISIGILLNIARNRN